MESCRRFISHHCFGFISSRLCSGNLCCVLRGKCGHLSKRAKAYWKSIRSHTGASQFTLVSEVFFRREETRQLSVSLHRFALHSSHFVALRSLRKPLAPRVVAVWSQEPPHDCIGHYQQSLLEVATWNQGIIQSSHLINNVRPKVAVPPGRSLFACRYFFGMSQLHGVLQKDRMTVTRLTLPLK